MRWWPGKLKAEYTYRTYVLGDDGSRELIFEGGPEEAKQAAIWGAVEYAKPCVARREVL